MKNLRKALALVVAIAMIASFGVISVSAATFTDVADNATYAEAVTILNNLGIILGYEDGTFKPDNTLTRAEAAVIMTRCLGMESAAQGAMGDTGFSDVTSAYDWATGYINVARQNNIINGYPDGTFKPGDELTYEQIVKMIVAALGYTPKAEANGGYPSGYLAIASQERITAGASGTVGQAAKRGTVARLVFNALEVEMMGQTTFVVGTGSTYTTNGKTLLYDYLGVTKVEAVVTATYLAGAEYDPKDDSISLTFTKDVVDPADKEETLYDKDATETFAAGNTDAAGYLGYSVIAYVGDTEDEEDVIFAIAPKSSKNNKVLVDADMFVENEDVEEELEDDVYKVYYKVKATDRKASYVELDADGIVTVVNGKITEDIDAEDLCANAGEVLPNGGSIEFLDNNNDGEYDYLFITSYEDAEEFVVEEIADEDLKVSNETDGEFEYDPEDEDVKVTFIKDGKFVDFETIQIGDTITVIDGDTDRVIVYISSEKVEGKITAKDPAEDTYTIGDKEYKLAEGVSAGIGDEGIFYINYAGKIAATDTTSVVGGSYAYLLAGDVKTSYGKTTLSLQYVDEAGKVVTSNLASKIKVYKAGEFDKNTTANNYAGIDNFDEILTIEDGEVTVTQQLVKLTKDGDVITAIQIASDDADTSYFSVDDKYEDGSSKYYKAEENAYGTFDFAEDAIAFAIDADGDATEDDVTVTTVANLFKDENVYNFLAYDIDETVPVVVVYNPEAAIDMAGKVFVVTGTKDVLVDDEEETIQVSGIQDGKKVTFVVDPDGDAAAVEFAKGEIYLLSTTADNMIDDATKLADEDAEYGITVTTDNSKFIVQTFGAFDEKDGKKFILEAISEDDIEDGDMPNFDAEDYTTVVNKSGIQYTLVDFSDSTTNPTISASTFSGAISTSSKYTSDIFVRVYDGDVVDVVVYRYRAE